MKTYDSTSKKAVRTLDVRSGETRQAVLGEVLQKYAQGKGVLQMEAEIGKDWKMTGRSDSNVIYNSSGNCPFGYWFHKRGVSEGTYRDNVTLHHIIPVELLKKFWNKIKRDVHRLKDFSKDLVDINLEQRKGEQERLAIEIREYKSGSSTLMRLREDLTIIDEKLSSCRIRIRECEVQKSQLESERTEIAEKRQVKVIEGFETLKDRPEKVKEELVSCANDLKETKNMEIQLLRTKESILSEIVFYEDITKDYKRLKANGIEKMETDFLKRKSIFANGETKDFVSGDVTVTGEEMKAYIDGRDGENKNQEKDQILASLFLWMPGNLVPGPPGDYRPHDGGDRFDEEAAQLQGNFSLIKPLYDQIYKYTEGDDKNSTNPVTEDDIILKIKDVLAKGRMNLNTCWILEENGKYVADFS